MAGVLGALLPWPASATIINVPSGQPDIRAAVAAAASGDTILIAPGIYTGGAFIQDKVLTFASRYLLTGDTTFVAQTVLDGVSGSSCGGASGCVGNSVLEFGANAHGSAIIGLTLENGENGVGSISIVDVTHCRVISNGDGLDFSTGAGGTFSQSLFEANTDDGIDLNGRMNVTVTNNIIRNNGDDGIEYRIYDFSGGSATTVITGNRITGNHEDGVQFIDYPGASPYVLRVEHNVFAANFDASGSSAAIGCMPNGDTIESLVGAPMAERLYVTHNTFIDESYGLVGGANVIALDNVFVGTQGSAVRHVSGSSIVSYAMFWNNGIDYETSVVDAPHMLHANPALNADGTLSAGSPAINAGTAFYQWNGETVHSEPPGSYLGSAPDLGAVEFGSGGNVAPTVSAGVILTVTLPAQATLSGTVSDDGLPSPPTLTTNWSVVSGAGPMIIQDPDRLQTKATFSLPGTYVVRLTATDGALTSSDVLSINVLPSPNIAPVVDAGQDQTITLPADAVLDGTLSDDGLPLPPGTLTSMWVKGSGPGAVSFQNAGLANTHASFGASGSYKLFLIASDGALSSRDSVQITVLPEPNLAPLVSAGPSQTIMLPAGALLDGTVSDDGHPVVPGALTTTWVMENGPVAASIQNPNLVDTQVSFTAPGVYVFRLIASDGWLSTSATTQVTVLGNVAPQVDAGFAQTITLPASASLFGTASDDGFPIPPGAITLTWSKGSGPGTVTFGNPGALSTSATFSTAGTYVLRLTASDAALATTDSVQITVLPQPPPVDRRIAAASDDTEEEVPTGTISANTSDIEMVTGATAQIDGLRFTNITVPHGATIVSAYIQFEADEAQSEITNLTFQGQAADNAPTFTTTVHDVSSRPRTTASAAWSPVPWTLVGEQGPNERTGEIKAVIQEIVNRPGWVSGNAIAIIVSGTGHRTARSFESVPAGAALLHIESGGASPSNNPPLVDAGPNQTITLPAGTTLFGSVSDDGLPNPPAAVTVAWSKGSGPGTVTFGNANTVSTSATFSAAGTYVLRLTANDGALASSDSLQVTVLPPTNSAPVVDAGPNQAITLPASASLAGSVSDDGLPNPPGAVTVTWSKGSGPGTVTFGNANTVSTSATFSAAGTYILRLTANDGALATKDSLQITVLPAANSAPVVDAGPNQTITLPASASLAGSVSDDGLPNPPGAVTVTWSKGSGPGTVTFGNPSAVSTSATFATAGTYILRLTANDGALARTDSVQITVLPQNFPPTAGAGTDQTVILPADAVLAGSASDDGLPNPPGALTINWTTVSGPGPVTFQNASTLGTHATFTTAGTYLLRLGVSDGALTAADTVQITVLQGAAPLERRIAASTDDAEESASGATNLASTNLQLVFNASNQIDGLRFTSLTIPKGAVITTAYVQFTAELNESGATSLTLRAQAADNPTTFAGVNLSVSSRPRSVDSVTWVPPAWTSAAAGLNQRTPELKTLIQGIVNRTGWASGNALVLIVTGTGVRTAYSFDGNAAQAPLLHVEYATGAASEMAAAGDSSGASGEPIDIVPDTGPGGEISDANGSEAGTEHGATSDTGVQATRGSAADIHATAVEADLPRELALRRIGPSPARGAVVVECALPEARPATLELHDIAGRCLATREVGPLGPGRHPITLASRLPAGVYVVRLSQGGQGRIVKVAVLR